MSELHGFRRGEETFYIMHLPNYKKPVIVIVSGSRLLKIASFDSEECAKTFCKLLEKWFGIIDEAESEKRNEYANEHNKGMYKQFENAKRIH